jgi:hypothetical protein
MRSISGFNSGSLDGSFAAGQPVSASALNKLAGSVDKNRPMMSNDIQFMAGTGGVAMGNPQQVVQVLPLDPWTVYDNGDGTFSVVPSTINGLIPCVGGTGSPTKLATATPAPKTPFDWSAADEQGYKSCYIYLQASPAAGSGGRIWPSSDFETVEYPTVFGYPDTMDSDDDTGYLLIALAKQKTGETSVSLTQFLRNPIWSERHKYSQPDSAYYFYYRV